MIDKNVNHLKLGAWFEDNESKLSRIENEFHRETINGIRVICIEEIRLEGGGYRYSIWYRNADSIMAMINGFKKTNILRGENLRSSLSYRAEKQSFVNWIPFSQKINTREEAFFKANLLLLEENYEIENPFMFFN